MRRAQDRARSARSRKNGARSAKIKSRALGALKLASEARDENVPAKRADFFFQKHQKCSYFHNFDRMWLVNELVLTFAAPIKYATAQFSS